MKQSILVIVKWILIITPFFYVSANAQTTLYRVDHRPPAVIFEHGFESWGDNFSVTGHIESPRGIGSGFISSSDSSRFPVAGHHMNTFHAQESYIYSFDVPPNTFNSYLTHRDVVGYNAAESIKMKINSPSNRGEILTVKSIPPEYIMKATVVQPLTHEEIETINPNYNPNAVQNKVTDYVVLPDTYVSSTDEQVIFFMGGEITEEEIIDALEASKVEADAFSAASAEACSLQ